MSKFILSGFGDEIDPNLDTQLSVMKKNGLHYIELRSVDGKGVTDFTLDETKAVKKRLDAEGFKVSSVGSSIGKVGIRDDFNQHLDLFRNTLEIAHILEAPYIRMFSFYIPKGEAPETCRDDVLERMSKLCDEAKGSGVRLLHENELDIYGDSPERCLDIAESLGHERIGLVFDAANFINLIDRVQIYPYAWHLLKKYVDYVHIKDAVHIDDPLENHHEVRPAGYGEGRIKDILHELDQDGYEGFLSVEPHLGYFAGFEKLEKRMVDDSMPKGGQQTFTVAISALKELMKELNLKESI